MTNSILCAVFAVGLFGPRQPVVAHHLHGERGLAAAEHSFVNDNLPTPVFGLADGAHLCLYAALAEHVEDFDGVRLGRDARHGPLAASRGGQQQTHKARQRERPRHTSEALTRRHTINFGGARAAGRFGLKSRGNRFDKSVQQQSHESHDK